MKLKENFSFNETETQPNSEEHIVQDQRTMLTIKQKSSPCKPEQTCEEGKSGSLFPVINRVELFDL